MVYLILYKMGKFLALLLPLKVGYFIARIICQLQFYFSAKDRKAVIYNIERVIGEDDPSMVATISRQVFENFGKYLIDFFRFSRLDKDFINSNVRLKNIECLDRALKEFPGVITVTAHLGNFELGGAVLAKLNYPFYAVALSHAHPKVNDFFNRQRTTCGVNVIPVGVALRKCYQLLTDKKIVAFLGDRDFHGAGVNLSFFGKQAVIPRGPAAFSLKTKAAIVPGFLVREENDSFCLAFEEPILPFDNEGKLKEENHLILEYLRVVERYIRKYPSQWYMFQPLFKE